MWHVLATIAQKTPATTISPIYVFVGIVVAVVGFVLIRSNKKSSRNEAEQLSLTGTGKKAT